MGFLSFLFKNLFRRRTRTLLTAMGVAISVGATVALLGISEGFLRMTVEAFTGRGVSIVVTANVVDQLSSDLDERLMDRIAEIPGVERVGTGMLELVSFSKGRSMINLFVNGWKPGAFQFQALEILRGRTLAENDQRNLLVGEKLAEALGKDVGDSIEFQRRQWTIVGVYRSFTPVENNGVIVPLAELQQLMAREGRVTGFTVVVDPDYLGPAEMEAICQQINQIKDEFGDNPLSAMTTTDFANSGMHIRASKAMAWITSAIAIIVGTLGMLNTMIMSIVERLREISILRAIGWRKSRVVRMVLGESLMISLAGAAIGIVGSIVITYLLTLLPEVRGFMQPDIAPAIIAQGFMMAVIVGLVGGVYPAWLASRLVPDHGLRHD